MGLDNAVRVPVYDLVLVQRGAICEGTRQVYRQRMSHVFMTPKRSIRWAALRCFWLFTTSIISVFSYLAPKIVVT